MSSLPAKCPRCGADLPAIAADLKGRFNDDEDCALYYCLEAKCTCCMHHIRAHFLGEAGFQEWLKITGLKDRRDGRPWR